MGKIRFTEPRELLSGEKVAAGEERDFGESENAAFVNNGVAEHVIEESAAAPQPAAPAAPAEAVETTEEVKSNV